MVADEKYLKFLTDFLSFYGYELCNLTWVYDGEDESEAYVPEVLDLDYLVNKFLEERENDEIS